SRQPGQHWLTALGVVMDAAAIALATFDTGPSRPPGRLVRRRTRRPPPPPPPRPLRHRPVRARGAAVAPVDPADPALQPAAGGRAGGRRRRSRQRRGPVPGRPPAPGTARAPYAAVRAGLGPVPPASRHLLPRAGRGHRAAAGAD